ncbi:MAG: HD domain-containing protein [Candidatus Dasytiphilus stammeri]
MISQLWAKRLQFIREAEKLKDTLRSSFTSRGRHESTAEHSWRLCLMAMTFEDQLKSLNFAKILKLCVIHDLGEALHGDIPAVNKVDSIKKTQQERVDLLRLMESLDDDRKKDLLQLWEDYEQNFSREAQVVKAFDKLETLLQHNQGDNPVDFDYQFNLTYGQDQTNISPLFIKLRKIIDEETIKKIKILE